MESSGRQFAPKCFFLWQSPFLMLFLPTSLTVSQIYFLINDVTLKHSIFVFFWRLGAERLVEPSLLSPLRSLLPRCPPDVWEKVCNSLGDVTAHGRD